MVGQATEKQPMGKLEIYENKRSKEWSFVVFFEVVWSKACCDHLKSSSKTSLIRRLTQSPLFKYRTQDETEQSI